MADQVTWREDGHQLSDRDVVVVLRFGPNEVHSNIKRAVADAADYPIAVLVRGGLSEIDVPLVLSCFAVANGWQPADLANGTNYHDYRMVAADVLLKAGFRLWPTNVFEDGTPDPRNEVHYDVVVTVVTIDEIRATLSGSDKARQAGRSALAESFGMLFDLLGASIEIDSVPGQPGAVD